MRLLKPLDILYFAATQIWGCYRLESEPCYREPAVMSSASFAVTYTSVYTDSEPRRVLWGADEELSEGGSPRVIVYGYDGLPMQPPHDPDYVPEPIYHEYIPLEDEHVFSVEEQPLPPVDSPTAESPGYVAESNPEEDPEEYEDDETEDGPVDYPIDGGEDGDDDDGHSPRDNADDEDEDEEDEDEEDAEDEVEHLAPIDSAVVVPTIEHVSLPEGTKPVIPPPSTDITTTRARITVRLQASISLPPEAEVERLLAMPTPPLSPLISLSSPSVGERLARCTTPSAHSSPPPVPSPFLPSSRCLTQTQTLRIASTQTLIDAVTAALPSPPLPPLPPSLYIPPHVDRSRYEVGESSTARLTGGQGVDYGFFSTLDAEERRRGIREVGYGIRDTWVDPAKAVPEIAPMTMGEDAQDSRTSISQRVTMDSQRVNMIMEDRIAHQETILIVEEETQHQVHETRSQMQQAEMAELQETDRRHQVQIVETLHVMRDMRREMGDMQAELLALREQ
ncbi:hypothetical protein Tco_1563868 [Tanacetum coccineum]